MSQKQNKFLSTLGLAWVAGKLTLGTEQVRDTVKKRRAHLVILASDTSDNTKKEVLDSCEFYKAEAITVDYTMSELAAALGKLHNVACVALTDIGFKNLVINSLEHQEV